MALTNDLGNRLSDFRVNLVNPELARMQAVGQTEAKLRQQAAAGMPDMSEVSKMILQGDMHSVDENTYLKAVNSLNAELNTAAADPISAFYSQEGKQLRQKISSLVNNPKRRELVQNFELNKEELKKARDRGILNDIYVAGGQIGGPRGLYGTVMDQWKFVDQQGGGENLLNFGQSNFAEARTRIENSIAKAGTTRLTQFQGEGGEAPTLTKIVTSQNNRQIDLAIKSLINDGAISQGDYDAFLGRAASRVVQRAAASGKQLSREQLQSESHKEMGDMIRSIGNLQEDYAVDITKSKNPNFAMGGSAKGLEDIGPISSALTRRKSNLGFLASGTSNPNAGFLANVPSSRVANNIIAGASQRKPGESGFRSFNNNQVLGAMGGTRGDNLKFGTLNQAQSLDPEVTQQVINRGELVGDVHYYDWPVYRDGTLVNEEDAQEYTRLMRMSQANLQAGMVVLRENGMDPLQVLESKFQQQQAPMVSTEIRVGFEEDPFMGSADDAKILEELDKLNIGGVQKFTDDEAPRYKEGVGYENDDIKEGSPYWQGPVSFRVDPAFNMHALNSIELGRTVGVDPLSALPNAPGAGETPLIQSPGSKSGNGQFLKNSDVK